MSADCTSRLEDPRLWALLGGLQLPALPPEGFLGAEASCGPAHSYPSSCPAVEIASSATHRRAQRATTLANDDGGDDDDGEDDAGGGGRGGILQRVGPHLH